MKKPKKISIEKIDTLETTEIYCAICNFKKSDLLQIVISYSMLLNNENVRDSMIHIVKERNLLIDNCVID